MTTNRLAERLLLSGLDDWLHLADIAWAAGQFVRDDESQDVVSVATEALAELLDRGFIQIGEVSDGGFFEWDVTDDEAIDRVRRGWRSLDREPQPGDVCWVADTALGNRHVHEISDGEVSAREGYLAMVEFLRAYVERARAGSLATLLADVEIGADGMPFDPAMWSDWLAAVEVARGSVSAPPD